MSKIQQILSAYPAEAGMKPQQLAKVIDKLYECAGVCLACADACTAETDPKMIAMSAKCMRLDNDCSDLCTVAARILTRQTGYDAPTTFAVIDAVRASLRACADACAEMEKSEHCQTCAQVCRDTEKLLTRVVKEMQAAGGNTDYPTEPPSATTPVGKELAGSRR